VGAHSRARLFFGVRKDKARGNLLCDLEAAMNPDLYTKVMLTVIALCVAWMAAKDVVITPAASAAGAAQAGEQVMALRIVTCLRPGEACVDVQKSNPLAVYIATP
jgi:hypothetical protein